ncbi:hypothetical protein [Acidianus manzaensis]|uniref:Uncharacterized protein n=1 Tax=Acidianus manzaensis TaxID=282676 RepID=A0A1W6JWE4_9CREN|nr:hypothetical protein [Acidianus manzaensis]ARM74569.1 hypothetical protein B6F84_00005 [Acidianus manzaensis]
MYLFNIHNDDMYSISDTKAYQIKIDEKQISSFINRYIEIEYPSLKEALETKLPSTLIKRLISEYDPIRKQIYLTKKLKQLLKYHDELTKLGLKIKIETKDKLPSETKGKMDKEVKGIRIYFTDQAYDTLLLASEEKGKDIYKAKNGIMIDHTLAIAVIDEKQLPESISLCYDAKNMKIILLSSTQFINYGTGKYTAPCVRANIRGVSSYRKESVLTIANKIEKEGEGERKEKKSINQKKHSKDEVTQYSKDGYDYIQCILNDPISTICKQILIRNGIQTDKVDEITYLFSPCVYVYTSAELCLSHMPSYIASDLIRFLYK